MDINFVDYNSKVEFFKEDMIEYMKNTECFDGAIYVKIPPEKMMDFMDGLREFNFYNSSLFYVRPTIWEPNEYVLENSTFIEIGIEDYLIEKGVRRAALIYTDNFLIKFIEKYIKEKYGSLLTIKVLNDTRSERGVQFLLYRATNISTKLMIENYDRLTDNISKELLLGVLLGYEIRDNDDYITKCMLEKLESMRKKK
jgi:hypothetical protein